MRPIVDSMPASPERTCPVCNGNSRRAVLTLTVQQVLDWNPGYLPSHYAKFDELLGLTTVLKVCRCDGCGFVFVPIMPSDELLQYDYGTVNATDVSKASVFDMRRRRARTAIWLHLLEMVTSTSISLTVLDFGCGWGDFLAVAKAPGVEVVGIEQNQAQVQFCKAEGIAVLESTEHIASGSIDVVICNQVLEHVPNPRAQLAELRRVAKRGAVGFFSVPDFTRFDWGQAEKRIAAGRSVVKEINPWEHLNYYDRKTFVRLLTESGFACLGDPNRLTLKKAAQLALRRRTGIANYVRVG